MGSETANLMHFKKWLNLKSVKMAQTEEKGCLVCGENDAIALPFSIILCLSQQCQFNGRTPRVLLPMPARSLTAKFVPC
jgi:hypothetical protein